MPEQTRPQATPEQIALIRAVLEQRSAAANPPSGRYPEVPAGAPHLEREARLGDAVTPTSSSYDPVARHTGGIAPRPAADLGPIRTTPIDPNRRRPRGRTYAVGTFVLAAAVGLGAAAYNHFNDGSNGHVSVIESDPAKDFPLSGSIVAGNQEAFNVDNCSTPLLTFTVDAEYALKYDLTSAKPGKDGKAQTITLDPYMDEVAATRNDDALATHSKLQEMTFNDMPMALSACQKDTLTYYNPETAANGAKKALVNLDNLVYKVTPIDNPKTMPQRDPATQKDVAYLTNLPAGSYATAPYEVLVAENPNVYTTDSLNALKAANDYADPADPSKVNPQYATQVTAIYYKMAEYITDEMNKNGSDFEKKLGTNVPALVRRAAALRVSGDGVDAKDIDFNGSVNNINAVIKPGINDPKFVENNPKGLKITKVTVVLGSIASKQAAEK